MLALEFPGCHELINALDQAVQHSLTSEITGAIRDTLSKFISEREVRLPECVFQTCGDHYARRELYRSEKFGYSVVAMTWGPTQGTPMHDHSGMWCVEGVWQGELKITQYELMEQTGDRFRFESRGSVQAGAGSTGSLIPPHEYHTIYNPSPDNVAVSLHIYRDTMVECSVFQELGQGWFKRNERILSVDQLA